MLRYTISHFPFDRRGKSDRDIKTAPSNSTHCECAVYIYCFWLGVRVSFAVLMNFIPFDKLFETDWLWCQLMLLFVLLLCAYVCIYGFFHFDFLRFFCSNFYFNFDDLIYMWLLPHTRTQTHFNRIIDWRMSTITSATMVMAILLFNISLESTTNFSLAHN